MPPVMTIRYQKRKFPGIFLSERTSKKEAVRNLHSSRQPLMVSLDHCAFFSHPDYTVGSGIHLYQMSPDQPLARVADFTAGGEFRPALKNNSKIIVIIHSTPMICKLFLS